jgi:hypothetical protein
MQHLLRVSPWPKELMPERVYKRFSYFNSLVYSTLTFEGNATAAAVLVVDDEPQLAIKKAVLTTNKITLKVPIPISF